MTESESRKELAQKKYDELQKSSGYSNAEMKIYLKGVQDIREMYRDVYQKDIKHLQGVCEKMAQEIGRLQVALICMSELIQAVGAEIDKEDGEVDPSALTESFRIMESEINSVFDESFQTEPLEKVRADAEKRSAEIAENIFADI